MARKKANVSRETTENGYYSLRNILKEKADYNIIFGERSNGKTYSVLLYGLQEYANSGYKNQMAIVRRWKEDIKGKRAETFFNALQENGEIEKATNGEYTEIIFANGKWYLSNFDTDTQKHIPRKFPLAFSFSLSEMEHDKSASFPNVTTVLFDEFLTRRYYLPDEFILFMNTLSTIIRDRNNVKIFMLGNTVNRYNPYFQEMGLKHADSMEQGTIDLYRFGSNLKIAVEYAASTNKNKPSNKYFAFDNSEAVKMIINGAWEMAIYPHLTEKFDKKDIMFTFFIEFGLNILQCEVIANQNDNYIYIHEKTTPFQNDSKDLIYSLEYHTQANYKRRLLETTTPLTRKIARYFALEKVFFQNNEVGEIVRNYIRQSEVSQFAK